MMEETSFSQCLLDNPEHHHGFCSASLATMDCEIRDSWSGTDPEQCPQTHHWQTSSSSVEALFIKAVSEMRDSLAPAAGDWTALEKDY